MVDYKYHVTTLVAIFLALGIGILIGSMMLGGDFVVEQQKTLIDRLENDFRQMRVQTSLVKNDLAAAKENIKNYQDFCQEMLPILAKDRLKGLRVAVIQTGNSFPIDDIENLLKLAGTEVKSVTTILEDFTIADVSANFPEEILKGSQLVRLLGETVLYGDSANLVPVLKEKKLVSTTGTFGELVDAVIMVGGSQTDQGEQAKWLDEPLIDYFLENEIRVIGVEASNAVHSYMGYYQSKPVATVDNIETVPGKIALLYALLGQEGNFGIKKTAQRLIPDLLN